MTEINRRLFLKLTGGAAAATALISTGARALSGRSIDTQNLYSFRAVAGLPARPMPSYASSVLEGTINLASGTGTVTHTIFAGAPASMSAIALPGLSSVVRVTGIHQSGDTLHVQGLVEETGGQAVKSQSVDIRIDPFKGTASTNLHRSDVVMSLDK